MQYFNTQCVSIKKNHNNWHSHWKLPKYFLHRLFWVFISFLLSYVVLNPWGLCSSTTCPSGFWIVYTLGSWKGPLSLANSYISECQKQNPDNLAISKSNQQIISVKLSNLLKQNRRHGFPSKPTGLTCSQGCICRILYIMDKSNWYIKVSHVIIKHDLSSKISIFMRVWLCGLVFQELEKTWFNMRKLIFHAFN